jgi:hypothetical protein
MGDTGWLLLVLAIAVVLIEVGRRWYRRRIAARLADKMLADVLKAKDGFRR